MWLALISLALVVFTVPLNSQSTTASLGGTALDGSGAAIPGARVTVRNVDTGLTQSASTDVSGAFLFPRLPIGNYELRVEKEGFATYLRSGITLTVDQAANLAVAMQLGQLSERVTVEANAELVDTRTATGGQLVDQRRVVDLPLEGRAAQTLVFLAAGTVDLSRTRSLMSHGGVYPGSQVAGVNGMSTGQVNYQLDGAGHNDVYLRSNLPFPNPDSVQEFNLQSSNFSADYGNAAGGIVNIVTRSGTNEIHGTAFEFLRNGAVNARNFFAPRHDGLKRNQFGGSAGGPIAKNKLFFFGTYQGTRVRDLPEGRQSFVPTAQERAGDFSSLSKRLTDPVTRQPFPNNQIPASRLNSVARYVLKWVPLPNGAGRELTFPMKTVTERDDQFMTKIDLNRGGHQLSGRYFFSQYTQPPLIPADNVLSANNRANHVRVQNIAGVHTFSVSPTLLLSSTFGLSRQRGGSWSTAPWGWPDAGSKIAAPSPPELSMSITGGFSMNTNHDGQFDRSSWTVREVVTKIAGPHEFRFGGDVFRVYNHTVNVYQQAGSFTFSGQLSGDGMADFIVGRASGFNQGGGEFKYLKGTQWAFFVQDDWRVGQRLTVNLGVRWDPYLPYYDREGRVICFQPGVQSTRYPKAPAGLTYGGANHDSGCPVGGAENTWGNIAPRIGFAYRLTRDAKTSLRGGTGYFYTPPPLMGFFNQFTNTAPFAPTFSFNDVAFEDPFGSVGVRNPFPQEYGPRVPGPEVAFTVPTRIQGSIDREYRIMQYGSWNLMLERQLRASWLLRGTYQGNKGTFLSGGREMNPAVYVPGASTVGNTQARRPFQNFSQVSKTESGINSHHHGLLLNIEKRFGHGLTVLANHSWQKTIMDSYTNPFSRRWGRGISQDDIAHTFKFSNVYQAPDTKLRGIAGHMVNGWSLNSILVWRGGFPLTIASGVDNAFTGTGSQRADYLGGNIRLASGRPRQDQLRQWFDTSRFTVNAIGTFGNSGSGILRGPKSFNTNLGVLKNFRVTEQTKVQFRAEFFNVLNHPNFFEPNTTVNSAQFGRISSADSPRIMQFGLKVLF
jgi:hypothetical protein